MQFFAHEDVEAPVDFVFAEVSNFPALERAALRRGVDVQRTDNMSQTDIGMTWAASYELRRTKMSMALELTRFEPPNALVIEGDSATLGGLITLDVLALSRMRTRISLKVDVHARTLPARLFLQSFKLARVHPGVTFKRKAASFAAGIEERYKSKA